MSKQLAVTCLLATVVLSLLSCSTRSVGERTPFELCYEGYYDSLRDTLKAKLPPYSRLIAFGYNGATIYVDIKTSSVSESDLYQITKSIRSLPNVETVVISGYTEMGPPDYLTYKVVTKGFDCDMNTGQFIAL